MRIVIQYAIYLVLAMVLQSLFFAKFSIAGCKGFILPAAAVAAGMHLGGVKGAVFGLFLGVFSDFSFTDSVIMYTILFSIIGFFAGFASEFYLNNSFFAFVVFGIIAVFITGTVQLIAAVITGGAEILPGLFTVLMQTLLSLPPALLLYLPFSNRLSKSRRR